MADRYVLSVDGKTQIGVEASDELHVWIWGWFNYSNRQYPNAELVECSDPLAWIKEQRKIKKARK